MIYALIRPDQMNSSNASGPDSGLAFIDVCVIGKRFHATSLVMSFVLL